MKRAVGFFSSKVKVSTLLKVFEFSRISTKAAKEGFSSQVVSLKRKKLIKKSNSKFILTPKGKEKIREGFRFNKTIFAR